MTDRHDFNIDMGNGSLIREDKFTARLQKKTYRALMMAVVKGDIAIEAARQASNTDPRKTPALVRMVRQRELVVQEMQRRVKAGFAPPDATVTAKPALLTAKAIVGGKGVQKGASHLIQSFAEPERVG